MKLKATIEKLTNFANKDNIQKDINRYFFTIHTPNGETLRVAKSSFKEIKNSDDFKGWLANCEGKVTRLLLTLFDFDLEFIENKKPHIDSYGKYLIYTKEHEEKYEEWLKTTNSKDTSLSYFLTFKN